MAKTKQSCFAEGQASFDITKHVNNPYKPDSWQANAWSDGFRDARAKHQADCDFDGISKLQKARNAAEAGQGQSIKDFTDSKAFDLFVGLFSTLAPFPSNMPAATRHHCQLLNKQALAERDSTRALRLDSKITTLYERYGA